MQDEVIAVSKKVVVRVEDLVKWTCLEPPHWRCSSPNVNGPQKSDESQDASSPQEGKSEGDGGELLMKYLELCAFFKGRKDSLYSKIQMQF